MVSAVDFEKISEIEMTNRESVNSDSQNVGCQVYYFADCAIDNVDVIRS